MVEPVQLDPVNFLKKMPKIELHAHLSGSLNLAALIRVGKALGMQEEEVEEKFGNISVFTDMNGCFQKFRDIQELLSSQAGLKLAVLAAIFDFAMDNVIYLELRTTPRVTCYIKSKCDYLEAAIQGIIKAATINRNCLVKLLPSIDRARGVNDARETLEAVINMRKKYPQHLPGIDFGGNPSIGRFRDYTELLYRARQNGLKVVLHCAEIKNPEEIQEMIEFGMDRCGHGTFLNDDQIRHLKDEEIPIECCITSNLRCGTVAHIDDHHFKRIFQERSAAVVLCTDDSGIFDTTLSVEYINAKRAYDLNKLDVKCIALNSVMGAFADDAQRENIRVQVETFFRDHMCIM